MFLVEAMPDELAAGQEGRFACLNRVQGNNVRAVLKESLKKEGFNVNNLMQIELLALISGMSPIAYAQAHSAIPALQVTVRPKYVCPHGELVSRKQIAKWGMAVPRKGRFLCKICVTEDMRRYGFSWYRRSHHLIGMDWCVAHGEPLSEVLAEQSFFAPPNIWLERKMVREQVVDRVEFSSAAPFLRRLSEISVAWLGLSRPVSTADLHLNLRRQGSAFCVKNNRGTSDFTIGSFVLSLAPSRWFEENLPFDQESYLNSALRIASSRYGDGVSLPVFSYVLLLAALYPTAEHAIEVLRDLSRDASVRENSGLSLP
ncbi:TniQ family protein [Aquabacterium sp.]|uniref:TniQ family protein n=1 Tax=Aquabacterium sp. TaxID=1872578 RepID=UPI003BB0BAB4